MLAGGVDVSEVQEAGAGGESDGAECSVCGDEYFAGAEVSACGVVAAPADGVVVAGVVGAAWQAGFGGDGGVYQTVSCVGEVSFQFSSAADAGKRPDSGSWASAHDRPASGEGEVGPGHGVSPKII